MARELRMPSLGQTTNELRILAWLKAEGETVRLGEPLLEVETDKATLVVESFVAGTLLQMLCAAGDVVEAGAPIAYVGAAGEAPPPVAESRVAPPSPTATAPAQEMPEEPVPRAKTLATPIARQLARTHGLDLARVRGSGPMGRVEKADVLALVEGTEGGGSATGVPPSAPAGAGPLEGSGLEPVPPHRQVIAQRLMRSATSIPQFTLTAALDMSRARARLDALNAHGPAGVTYTHLILRAVGAALRQHPGLNRQWVGEGPAYRRLERADVGLAVAGEDSLLVVSIPEPDRLALPDLARVVDEAAHRGRAGTLISADRAPVAVTVSNLGMYRVDSFTAIVDPDQTAILAVGRIVEDVMVHDSALHIVPRLTVSLTVDHRVADGVAAAAFLESVRARLESYAE